MIRGLRISASALEPRMRAQEILSNNLANVSTPGFRQDRVAFHRVLEDGLASLDVRPSAGASGAAAATFVKTTLDASAGAPTTTENPFDLSLTGRGFFVLQGANGELNYTRDGALHLGEEGMLLHRSGNPILTESGPIQLASGETPTIRPDGTLLVGGETRGKLRVVELPDPSAIRRAGANLIRSDLPGIPAAEVRVVQGAIEAANVDPVDTMVQMMALVRGFEANQRALMTQDAGLGQLIRWASS